MVKPINIEPQQILSEVATYQAKLAKWVDDMAKAAPLTPFSSPFATQLEQGKFQLKRFTQIESAANKPVRTPIVICYALVNRPNILDLQPDRSLIKNLLAQGLDIYLIDWGYPDRTDRYMQLSEYLEFINTSIAFVTNQHAAKPALLGVCQGGTLSLCHAALHPASISQLITMITPVDFSTADNTLGKWVQDLDVSKLVALYGNIPGGFLNSMFVNLKPFLLGKQKYIDALSLVDDPNRFSFFRRMEHWINDSPDLAGQAFQQFTELFYKNNLFFSSTPTINDKLIDLKKITCRVLNIYANQDHIVPPSASIPLANLIGSTDYDTASFDTGHIGIYVSNTCLDAVPAKVSTWLK